MYTTSVSLYLVWSARQFSMKVANCEAVHYAVFTPPPPPCYFITLRSKYSHHIFVTFHQCIFPPSFRPIQNARLYDYLYFKLHDFRKESRHYIALSNPVWLFTFNVIDYTYSSCFLHEWRSSEITQGVNIVYQFYILLTVHLDVILVNNQLDALFFNVFISCLYMFRATSAHHQEGQIVLIHHLV
jgi:hypothetical protein